MVFPQLSTQLLLERLTIPGGRLNMVLDTDTYNEIDDQFALAYALRSEDRLNVEAVYAAPFFNDRSTSPADGMERSYEEIYRVLEKLDYTAKEDFVLKGSQSYLKDSETPCDSPAARDLVKRAMASEEPLYVAAVGAITNIASAILMEPRIIEKIVVLWLGGNALSWPTAKEFNLMQDVAAVRVVLDSGVPFILFPCKNVVSHLITLPVELERFLEGKSAAGDYLTQITRDYCREHKLNSKVIWDIAPVAYLINPDWISTHVVHSPILTDQLTWSTDQGRHFIKTAYHLNRDRIFNDLFARLA